MTTVEDTKLCPYCAETIKKEALICRFCNYDLRTGTLATPAAQPQLQPVLAEPTSPPTVQARSSVMDGVKLGTGMFIVLPLLCILGLLLMCSFGGALR